MTVAEVTKVNVEAMAERLSDSEKTKLRLIAAALNDILPYSRKENLPMMKLEHRGLILTYQDKFARYAELTEAGRRVLQFIKD